MKYEEENQEYVAANDEHNYEEDTLEEIYSDAQEFVEDDSIADWEEGFMQGYAQA